MLSEETQVTARSEVCLVLLLSYRYSMNMALHLGVMSLPSVRKVKGLISECLCCAIWKVVHQQYCSLFDIAVRSTSMQACVFPVCSPIVLLYNEEEPNLEERVKPLRPPLDSLRQLQSVGGRSLPEEVLHCCNLWWAFMVW